MVAPSLFLIGSLFVYATIADGLESSAANNQKLTSEIESFIKDNPERAISCGINFTIRAQKHNEAFIKDHLSGLRHFLVNASIALFCLSFIMQILINRRRSANP